MTLPILVLFGGEIIDAVPRPLVTLGRLGSFSLNVAAGIWAIWLYAAIRPVYGPGPKTAAIAGFSWWMVSTIAIWQWKEIGLLRFNGLIGLILASLPILIAVTMFGAWNYREKDRTLSHQ
jgi:Na+/H+ antiporter NhaC